MNSMLKRAFFRFLKTVSSLIKMANRHKLTIIYYHRIVSQVEIGRMIDKNMCTETNAFEEQMSVLAEKYIPVNEMDILNALEGRKKFPAHPVWITFDDGYKDNYVNAFPILKKFKIPATFFITTGFINKTAWSREENHQSHNELFMSWDEIKDLSTEGFGIGCHTVNHHILSELSRQEVEQEIKNSKNEIEDRIGKPILLFAYPHGKWHECAFKVAIPILKKYGIRLAVTTVGGTNGSKLMKKEPLSLHRFGVSHDDSIDVFKTKVATGSFWQI